MKVVLGDVAVVVKDAKASAKWWKQKCGFEIRDNVGHWITVAPPGGEVVIHLCAGEGYAAESGNTGIGFFVDDVAAIEKAWTKKGVVFSVPRRVGSASVQAKFLDPDGNEYWLFEDEDLRPRARAGARAGAGGTTTTKARAKKKAKASAKPKRATKKR